MRYALYLTLLTAVLPFVFARPFFGLCVYFVVSFLQPKLLCWHPELQDSLIVGAPLVVGAALFGVFRRAEYARTDPATGRVTGLHAALVRNGLVEPSWLVALMIVLLAYIGVTRLAGEFPLSKTNEEFSRLCKIVLVTALMTGLTPDRRRMLILYAVVALATAFWAIKGGMWVFVRGPHQVYGMDYDNNHFALRSVMALPMMFCLALALPRRRRRWRIALYVACGLTCLAIIGSGSRSGFLALAFVLLGLAWHSGHRIKAMSAVALFAVVAAALSWQDIRTRYDSIVNYSKDKSASSRFEIWAVAWEILDRNPVIGVGFNNFERAFEQIRPRSRAAHNIWLQNLVELGLLGHPLWLGLIAGTAISLARSARRARLGPPELRQGAPLARGLLLGLGAFWIHGMFHNDEYLDLMFTFVGFAVVLRVVQQRERAALALRAAAGVADESGASDATSGKSRTRAAPGPIGVPAFGGMGRMLVAGRSA